MAKKPKRPRTERRAHERQETRAVTKEIAARTRLADAAPGGAATHPIIVSSAAVIDGKARGTPCPLCAGDLDLREHTATSGASRVVNLICRRCHTPRVLHFRIEAKLAN